MEEDPIDTLWTHTWDARGILRLLNILFKRSLTEESPKAEQPPQIKVCLRPHQRAIIAGMERLETQSLTGHSYGQYKTYANYGFVGDEVGTGKSLMILSHIANMKNTTHLTQNTELLTNNCPHLYTIKTHDVPQNGSTLLVVPHTLFRQWQTYIKDHTTLKCFAVKTRANLNIDTFQNNVRDADFVLVSNTLYKDTVYFAKEQNVTWKRLFVDEADSIHIVSTSAQANAGFTWFITASWANFLLHGSVLRSHLLTFLNGPNELPGLDSELKQWLRNEIGTQVTPTDRWTYLRMNSHTFFREFLNSSVFRSLQVLRCRQTFIEESMSMPPIENIQVLCEQPLHQQLVHHFVSGQIQAMLHGGDIQGALEHLGVKAEDSQTLLQAFMTQQKKELDRLQKTLAFKESMEYATPQAKEAALTNLQTKIASVEQQMKTFQERIESLSTELCPICYDEPKNTTLTPCCHRIFCGQCMLTCLVRTPTCPMCRTAINPTQLIHVKEDAPKKKPVKQEGKQLLKKPEALLDFITKNTDARVLVFSRYENPFAGLAIKCEEAGIKVDVLKGNKDCIANTIKEFESGVRRVLFLPTQTAGAGMNLVGATHVVLYHAMTPEEERQVIGRAYRLGRKDPLKVVRLVHETESAATTNSVA